MFGAGETALDCSTQQCLLLPKLVILILVVYTKQANVHKSKSIEPDFGLNNSLPLWAKTNNIIIENVTTYVYTTNFEQQM